MTSLFGLLPTWRRRGRPELGQRNRFQGCATCSNSQSPTLAREEPTAARHRQTNSTSIWSMWLWDCDHAPLSWQIKLLMV